MCVRVRVCVLGVPLSLGVPPFRFVVRRACSSFCPGRFGRFLLLWPVVAPWCLLCPFLLLVLFFLLRLLLARLVLLLWLLPWLLLVLLCLTLRLLLRLGLLPSFLLRWLSGLVRLGLLASSVFLTGLWLLFPVCVALLLVLSRLLSWCLRMVLPSVALLLAWVVRPLLLGVRCVLRCCLAVMPVLTSRWSAPLVLAGRCVVVSFVVSLLTRGLHSIYIEGLKGSSSISISL